MSVGPDAGATATLATEDGVKTTVLERPDRLFAFLPRRSGALGLVKQPV